MEFLVVTLKILIKIQVSKACQARKFMKEFLFNLLGSPWTFMNDTFQPLLT